jgi:hypothetical protein
LDPADPPNHPDRARIHQDDGRVLVAIADDGEATADGALPALLPEDIASARRDVAADSRPRRRS